MFRGGFLLRFFLTLLLVGLLVGGGVALYRAGWAQGYQTGVLTAASAPAGQGSGSGQSQVAPFPPYYAYVPWFYGRGFYGPGFGFFPFFPLFGIGFFFIVFFLVGGLFRMWGYRRWGPGPGYWRHEHEGREQPQPPAAGDQGER